MKIWHNSVRANETEPTRGKRRNLFFGAAMLLLALVALIPASVARADERDFALRYDVLTAGANIAQIGNSLTTCLAGSVNQSHQTLTCADTQSGSNGSADSWFNDQYNVIRIDVDGDASTSSSSTATLNIPATATMLHAQLYWGGSYNPSTSWDLNAANVMKLKGPTGGYNSVTSTQTDWKDVTVGSRTGRSYGATADVTSLFPVNNSWLGASKVFTGADVASTLGCTSGNTCPNDAGSGGNGSLGNYAGWSLLIVYKDTADSTVRYVGINDGFKCVVGTGSSCNSSESVTFTGFNIPANSNGNRWGILAWDGDRGTGDNFSLNGVQQSDASHPVNDYFNSRISVNGAAVATRNPTYTNNLGIDLVESNTGNFTGGTTSIPGTISSSQELVLLHFFWLVTTTTQIDYDYGDDPSSYGSASHQISGNTSATNLRLGTDVTDSEAGMQHSTAANGDNILNTNDEQGVTFQTLPSNKTSYTVSVSVTNNLGAGNAHVYAWMDFDRDGVFETNEYVSSGNIASGTTNSTITLSWSSFTAIPQGTSVYFRFRITTNTLTSSSSTGVATNGEVEDYRIIVGGPTAATLTGFKAKVGVKGQAAQLKWATGSELTLTGFKVWRSTKRDGKYKLLTPDGIQATAVGQIAGGKYKFKDKDVKSGKTYYYKVEVLKPGGATLEWSDVKKVQMP